MKFITALLFFVLFPTKALADRYIVLLKPGSNYSAVSTSASFTSPMALIQALTPPVHVEKFLPSIDGFVSSLSFTQMSLLNFNGDVQGVFKDGMKYLVRDYLGQDTTEPSDYTYGLKNIRIPELHAEYPRIDGRGVKVGIIDSGIDPEHPSLKGKVLRFKDFVSDKPTPYDDNGHGTHVAGTVSGMGSELRFGVAPRVKLVIAKVFSASGGASDSTILAAMEWMQSQGVAVVSNSWGGEQDSTSMDNPYSRMLSAWVEKRMVPVFAAGNAGPNEKTISVPGGLPDALAVGAVDQNDATASFSSRGPITWDGADILKPDLCAPGVKIYSSIPGGAFKAYSGTSMATPHAAGVAALIIEANPRLSVLEVKSILTSTADKIGSPVTECGSGRLNAQKAVEVALSGSGS